jgi:hypothetical protein
LKATLKHRGSTCTTHFVSFSAFHQQIDLSLGYHSEITYSFRITTYTEEGNSKY